MKLFDYINSLTYRKDFLDFSSDEISKNYNPYITNRFLSMSEALLFAVNDINKYDVPKEIHYLYYLSTIPQRKFYLKYISKPKDVDDVERRLIAHYFDVGKNDVDMYIDLMSEEDLKELLKIYTCGNKIIDV